MKGKNKNNKKKKSRQNERCSKDIVLLLSALLSVVLQWAQGIVYQKASSPCLVVHKNFFVVWGDVAYLLLLSQSKIVFHLYVLVMI